MANGDIVTVLLPNGKESQMPRRKRMMWTVCQSRRGDGVDNDTGSILCNLLKLAYVNGVTAGPILFIHIFCTQVRGHVQQQLNLPLQHFTHHHFIKTDGFLTGGLQKAYNKQGRQKTSASITYIFFQQIKQLYKVITATTLQEKISHFKE